MLIDTVDPTLQISRSVLTTIVLLVGTAAAGGTYLVIKASQRQPTTGKQGMIGKTAQMRANGMAYVDGALWKIDATDVLTEGDIVEIVGMDKLTLQVKKTDV